MLWRWPDGPWLVKWPWQWAWAETLLGHSSIALTATLQALGVDCDGSPGSHECELFVPRLDVKGHIVGVLGDM